MLSQGRAEQFLTVVSVPEREGVQGHMYVSHGTEGVEASSWCWPPGFLVTLRQLAGQGVE